MFDVRLNGCRTEPLGSYLKALGLLRLVSEQVDPEAAGWWEGDHFRLRSSLDLDGLARFLAEEYHPTPLLAPWNNGGGFADPTTSKRPTADLAIRTIEESSDPRLEGVRAAIQAVQRLRQRTGWYALDKDSQVALCRNWLPDSAVDWLDAAVVLSSAGTKFPPILGSGGNDGSLELTSNFVQRLAELFGLVKRPRGAGDPAGLARDCLTATQSERVDRVPIGQFDPGGAGGPGSSPLGSAESLANPWNFVLALEGALMFASSAARRLSSGVAAVTVPFIVSASRSGHPSWTSTEDTRGELWAPLWEAPTQFPEIQHLIGEGRAEYSGRQSRNGLDLVRAVSSLGVDRGIDAFVRYAFVVRNGLSTFAVSLGRIDVRERQGVAALSQLDRWVSPLRTAKNPPDSLVGLIRRLDDAQFAVASGGGVDAVQNVLAAVAATEMLASRSGELRKVARGRVTGLSAKFWVPLINDGSAEAELAIALGSLRGPKSGESWLRQVLTDSQWLGRQIPVSGFGSRRLVDVLADALVRLAIKKPMVADGVGRWLGGPVASSCRLQAIESFLAGDTDDDRLGRLLAACLVLDWRDGVPQFEGTRESTPREYPPHPLMALLMPFFHRQPMQPPFADRMIVADSSWPLRLVRGDIVGVARDALRRSRIAGLRPYASDATQLGTGIDPIRLAAACLIPLTGRGVLSLLRRSVVTPPSSTPATEYDQPSLQEAASL